MHNSSLGLDAAGSARTYDDASTTLRDFARICEVALRGGMWGGRQVVSADWIRAVVTPQPLAPDARYGVEAYGMLWWLNRNPVVYMTKGFLDTDCYAFPEHNVVIARMQRTDGAASQVPYSFPRLAEIVLQLVSP
jgi:CubicO group peptidase (beta-lactamase class C family)